MFPEGSSRVRVLNSLIENECTISQVRALRISKAKNIMFVVLAVLTFGFTWLLAYWSSTLHRRLRYQYCDLARATHFLFLNWDDVWEIAPRQDKHFTNQQGATVCRISFENRFIAYYYDPDKEVFCTARYQLGQTLDQLSHGRLCIHSEHKRLQLLEQFGRNLIEVPVSSKLSLFVRQVLSPFEVFQFYAIILWYCEAYYIFPTVLIIASLITYLYNVALLQQTQKKLKEDSLISVSVQILVGDADKAMLEHRKSEELVPGDLFYLKSGDKVPCDSIILIGAGLANENYITGDPYPVRKAELQNFVYKSDHENEFTLYMGTQLLEIQVGMNNKLRVPVPEETSVLCLATRTNYYSVRGQYLRSILYPKTHSMQFYTESIKFILMILVITLVGFLVVCLRVGSYLPMTSLFMTLLDLMTTSIPPTLPTAMSVGIGFAIQRLYSLNIKCSLPQKILVGGQVETVCFEKTGTLTKKDVTVIGLALCERSNITGILTSPKEIAGSHEAYAAYELMATCHSVSRSISQGNLGKPTDTAMFQFSTAKILDSHNEVNLFGKKITILKRFQFSFALQRMAVIIKTEDCERKLFVKGDPERVIGSCRENSVPPNISQFIASQSQKGFKLMALSTKQLDNHTDFDDNLKKIQKDMTLLGILIFENSLQPVGQQTVRTLLRSNVRIVVLSGDSQLTSGAVAFGCGMLDNTDLMYCDIQVDAKGRKKVAMSSRDSLSEHRQIINKMGHYQNTDVSTHEVHDNQSADDDWIKEFTFSIDDSKPVMYGMTGRLFEELFMKRNINALKPVFLRTVLFSRMLPKHKVGLFQYYQNIGQACAFVGENTREASSFRHADLSLALTQGEVSTFSHFSSTRGNLGSIIDLLRVCRAGLSTNFQTFKMMCQFSLMEFTTMIILYLNYESLTSSESLYIDLFIMCPIFITLSLTEPCDTLSKFRPPASLFSKFNILSMMGLFILQLIGQIIIVQLLKRQQFYTDSQDRKLKQLNNNKAYNQGMLISSTLFIFTNFLYMGVVIATSISKPFRKDFYTNPYLVANILLLTISNLVIPFIPQLVPNSMMINPDYADWYFFVVLWANILCVVMYVYERALVWMMEKFWHHD